MSRVPHPEPDFARMTDDEVADWIEHATLKEFGPPIPGPAARRGRPSMSGQGRTAHLSARIPESVLRPYRRAAQRRGTTVSEVIRETLAQHPPR